VEPDNIYNPQDKFSLKKGDRVRITGTTESLNPNTGTILTAENHTFMGGWYLEIDWDNDVGYGYYKQKLSGGIVEKLLIKVQCQNCDNLTLVPDIYWLPLCKNCSESINGLTYDEFTDESSRQWAKFKRNGAKSKPLGEGVLTSEVI